MLRLLSQSPPQLLCQILPLQNCSVACASRVASKIATDALTIMMCNIQVKQRKQMSTLLVVFIMPCVPSVIQSIQGIELSCTDIL